MTDKSCEYRNITLLSGNSDGDNSTSVTVFLPLGTAEEDSNPLASYFYNSTRFEHGSMVGLIRFLNDNVYYGTDLWRAPHDPFWPESGVGLASEFGFGDDGASCSKNCGWESSPSSPIANGVLGYDDAKAGEPFLKIGVGALLKASCEACDANNNTDTYRFNSPYQFSSDQYFPWKALPSTDGNTVVMEQEAFLEQEESSTNVGYRLRKVVTLKGTTLKIESTLTNLGSKPFTTPWYSHHFFTCNGIPAGPGYTALLQLKNDDYKVSAGNWSAPLSEYADIQMSNSQDFVNITLTKKVETGTRIKAEFSNDFVTDGSFVLDACGASISERLEPISHDEELGPKMYAFNLYMEEGTISPEPILLLTLGLGQSQTWTQQLDFQKIKVADSTEDSSIFVPTISPALHQQDGAKIEDYFFGQAKILLLIVMAFAFFGYRRVHRTNQYSQIS
eukprot:scaffold26962_cov48-Attheya_sp.AAC.1